MIIEPQHITTAAGQKIITALLARFVSGDDSCRPVVEEILKEVKTAGDNALVKYTRKFDAPQFTRDDLLVKPAEIDQAYKVVDADFLATLALAIERVHTFHEREREDSWMLTRENGTIVGRLVRPVDRAGLYVPGGTGGSTPLVSSVLMNGIPAAIAAVPRRIMVTPPAEQGSLNAHLLVAAHQIGITEIYQVGSAWAIGALAYGTETIPAVDVIVGPGNQYVTEAKKQVSGMVRIDMIAGPSEVLIVTDDSGDPELVAADMLAQAEHDRLALAVVITTDPNQAKMINHQLALQLKTLERGDIARQSLSQRGQILVADSVETAIELANEIAIEHLELMVADPWSWLPKIRHAGAIFLGRNTPEAAGDYLAGPNHVLPTMGTARFASALGVETFLKKSSLINYSKEALLEDSRHIKMLAELEGLGGHAASVTRRIAKLTGESEA